MKTLYFVCFFSFFLLQTPTIAIGSNGLSQAQQAIVDQQYAYAEVFLKQWLESNADDTTASFLLARVYAWQNKFEDSITIYNLLLEKTPDNADYLLGKAQTQIWNQKPLPALNLLTKARNLSPDYQDVWQLELRTLHQLQDASAQQQYNLLLAQASRRFPGAYWLESLANLGDTKVEEFTEIEFGGSSDKLSNDLSSWHSYFIGINHTTNSGDNLYGALRTTKRFGLNDRELTIGNFYNLSADWSLNLGASYSPTYKVLPHWSVYTNISRNLRQGWNTQVGLRYREYDLVITNAGNITFERYWSHYRARYVLYITSIDGDTIDQETETSHLMDIAYYYVGSNHIGLSLSKGKELEYNGTDDILIAEISNVSIFGRHWLLNKKWAVKYLFEYHEQGTFYSRYGFRLGLLYRF